MIYLIGTNHEIQHTAPPTRGPPERVEDARREFMSYLEKRVLELTPSLIAEEFSKDVLDWLKADSNARIVAEMLGIEHRFCDPDLATRGKLGLPMNGTENLPEEAKSRFHAIREDYWLQKISDRLDSAIIFVCGAEHIPSFVSLLMAKKCEVKVLVPYWGEEVYEKQQK